MPKLTKRAVDAAQPNGRDYFLWDAELAGFGLRVFASGKRSYLIQYKRHGRTRRLTIGPHGALTPDEARRRAAKLFAELADGGDPAEKRAEARRDLTVAELCDLYLAEGTAVLKSGTLATYRSAVERHIKPLLGKRRLGALTRGDIEKFQADVASGRTAVDQRTGCRGRARVTGGKVIAGRATAYLASILSFSVRRGLRADNPAQGVRLLNADKRERFLSPVELARLGDALAAAERESANSAFVAAVRLLLLTGCRKNEILRLRWSEVEPERGLLRLSDSKTGAKVVPLGAAALEVLANLPRTGDYVLPASTGSGHAVGLQKFWERLRRRAGLDDVRLHDLRHSFASVAVAGGDSLFLIGKVLGHRQARMTERYSHVRDDPLRAVADRASATIAAAMKGRDEGEVVKLPSKR